MGARHTTTWTGAVSRVWPTAGNWTNGVPTDSSNAIFPAGAPNYPQADFELYDYSAGKWVSCGNLFIAPGVNLYFGTGNIVTGIVVNEGTLIYRHPTNNSYQFTAWSPVAERAYITGNGTIRYLGGPDGTVMPFKIGNNSFEISLNNTADIVYFDQCNYFKNLNLVKGNIGFQNAILNRFYVGELLAFTAPSRVSGGSITATLRNNQTVTFPIGDATYSQPATIALANSADPVQLTASFSTTITGAAPNPTSCVVNGQPVSTISNRGIWTINAAAPLASGATYDATFRLSGSTNTTTPDRYALLKRENSSGDWAPAGTYQAGRDSAGYAIARAAGISSFSDFAIGIADAALPVRSAKLFATKKTGGNLLSWAIEATDATSITIESSKDGVQFSSLAQLPYAATGQYLHVLPAANNWYRLSVADITGREKLSNIAWVSNKAASAKLYPTLVTQSFFVQNDLQQQLQLQVFDVNGKMVMQQIIRNGNSMFNAQSFAPGMYYYKLMDGKTLAGSGSLVKQ
ncbi:MAG: T9SS type A sorting domain-containing protein [Sphingobacteriales bacterium]|nr:MAG: T9SS type A sorting domain-containing protein [Sphingobacteriales bacterium]